MRSRPPVRRGGILAVVLLLLVPIFAMVACTSTASRTATAVATLRGGTNITSFKGSGGNMLPLGMSVSIYDYLTGAAVAPAGTLTDSFTVSMQIDGGPAPPGNVAAGGDG